MTDEERKALLERLRDMGEHPCRVDLPMGADLREAADQIEADGQRIAELKAENERLREALEWYVAEDEKYIRAALGVDTV